MCKYGPGDSYLGRRINEDVEEEIAIVVAFSRLVDGAYSVCLRVPRNAIERHRHPSGQSAASHWSVEIAITTVGNIRTRKWESPAPIDVDESSIRAPRVFPRWEEKERKTGEDEWMW